MYKYFNEFQNKAVLRYDNQGMESNTIYISGGDIDEELETEILEIYTSGPNASGRLT